MEYRPIIPMDTFTVINKTIFQEKDRKILTTLYQPIIGVNATSLYLTLWDCLDHLEIISDNYTHHFLVNSLMLSLSSILDARLKLEAIGLIKTYIKSGENTCYVYELYSPASASEFFKDPILSTLLASTIGTKEFNNILNYYKCPKFDMDGYEEITSSFQDIFKIGDVVDSNKVDEIKNTITKLPNKLNFIYAIASAINNIIVNINNLHTLWCHLNIVSP